METDLNCGSMKSASALGIRYPKVKFNIHVCSANLYINSHSNISKQSLFSVIYVSQTTPLTGIICELLHCDLQIDGSISMLEQ